MRRSLHLYLILSTFMILLSPALQAQKAVLKGKVKDATNQEILIGANVFITPKYFGAATNEDGAYIIKNIPAGRYKVAVTYLGYLSQEKDIELKAGQEMERNFLLEPGPIMLSPTEIEVKADNVFTHGKTKILQEMIEQEATRDIGDYLRTIPNVSGVRKGGSNIDPVIRGFKFDQLNVHMDGGVRIEGGCPNRMDPTSAHVEMEDIENIEIIKGPYVLRYGPTFGGIVNLVTKKPTPSHTGKFEIHARAIKGYETNWRGDKEHVQIYGGTDRVYFTLAGAQLRYGNYTDGRGEEVSSGFHKWNYSGKLAFRPFENHEVMFSYVSSHGRDVMFPALPMDERIDNTRIMAFDYTAKEVSELIEDIKVKVYQSYVEHIMDNKEKPFGDTVAAVSAIDPTNFGGRAEIGLNLGEGHIYIGSDFEIIDKFGTREKNFYRMPPTNMETMPYYLETIWADANIQNNGVFMEYSNRWGTFKFISALRLDLNRASSDSIKIYTPNGKKLKATIGETESNYTNVSASIGVNKQINEKISLGLGVGRGVRSPNMLERFIILLPVGFDKYDYLGNPQLKPEANHQVDLNIKYKDEDIGGFHLNGFYSYVIDYISARQVPASQIQQNTSSALGVKEFYNVEDPVTFTGFEFTYSTPSKFKLGGQVIAAYTMGTFGSNYLKLNKIENDPVNEIPPFETNIMLRYKMFNEKLIPRFTLRVVAAQDRISETFDEQSTPGFTVANFGLVYKHSKYVTVSGGINNILDVDYYEHLSRRMLGTKDNFYEPGRVVFVNLILNI